MGRPVVFYSGSPDPCAAQIPLTESESRTVEGKVPGRTCQESSPSPVGTEGNKPRCSLVKQRSLGQDFKSSVGKSPGFTTQPASGLETSRPGSQAFRVLRARASAGASHAARSQAQEQRPADQTSSDSGCRPLTPSCG